MAKSKRTVEPAKKPAPTKAKQKPTEEVGKLVAENRKALFKYDVLDTLECGVALTGSEVKTLRSGKISLDESYARVREGEVWLVNCDIPEYKQAGIWNHPPKRPRKLLMHRSEVRKFAGKAHEKGLTLVPLKVYFNARGLAKIILGLCHGRKLHDKREVLKKADAKREIDRRTRGRR